MGCVCGEVSVRKERGWGGELEMVTGRGLAKVSEVGYRGYALVLPHGRIDYQ